MHLVTSIMRVQQAYLGRIEAILRPSGLTFARFEVLRLLAFSRLGSLPVGKVGERLQVHPASVTNAVQRLEADGLVVRRTNPGDRRSVFGNVKSIRTPRSIDDRVDPTGQVYPGHTGHDKDFPQII
jgi:DNA-binding MarR family transcriptional regulator